MSGAVEQRSSSSRALVTRRALASLASFGVAAILLWMFSSRPTHLGNLHWVAAAPLIAAPVIAGVTIWSGRLALQLLARALWWSLLLLGGLVSLIEGDAPGLGLALGSAVGLLGAGRTALDAGEGRFKPVAFRGTLMLALVLAMADAASFFWLGVAQTIIEGRARLILFVPPMIAGVVGLLRLQTWGLLVSLACNLLVVVLAGTGLLELPPELKWLFVGTAIAQLLVPAPMLISIARRRTPAPDGWARTKRFVSGSIIVGIAAVSVISALCRSRTFGP